MKALNCRMTYSGMQPVPAVVIAALVISCLAGRVEALQEAGQNRLQIYLPRETKIKGDVLSLGMVAVVQGDPALAAKAGSISLGRFALGGQKIILDRLTILGRLASNGIGSERVELSGADRVIVRRDEQVISGAEFAEAAEVFLKGRLRALPGGESLKSVEPVTEPKDWIVAGEKADDVKLIASMAEYGTSSRPKVRVDVVQDGTKAGGQDIAFGLKYSVPAAVAVEDIPAGAVISPQLVRIESAESPQPGPMDWSPPYGMIAKRNISKGQTVSSQSAGMAEKPVLIKRRDRVVLRYETPAFVISDIAEALDDGKAGDCIKVRRGQNSDARIVYGKIMPDGTVEPVL